MTQRASRRYPPVTLASPVGHPPRVRHSASSSGPAARWIAPSTPPPPSSELLAALTMASTASVVMSVRMISIFSFMAPPPGRRPARRSGPQATQQRQVDGIHLVVVPLGGLQNLRGRAEARVVHQE